MFPVQGNDWGDQLDVRYHLADRLSKFQNKKILDIGCGNGYLLSILPASNEKYGVDVQAESIAQASARNPNAHIQNASMLQLPFPDETFDVAYMANTLPHADFQMPGNRAQDQRTAITHAARVLKPDGTFLLSTPNNARYHTVKETYDELDALLQDRFNYHIQGWNPFPNWPFFAPNRVLRQLPGWPGLLGTLCTHSILVKRSKFFYVEATKKH